MNPRDRKLRRARRLGVGIVATGVAGSLGVAGLVGLSSLQKASTAAAPTRTTPSTSYRQSGAQQVQPGRHSDDGFSFPSAGSQNQTQTESRSPTLQPGSGAPHATTSGS
jgi:hypothetical protein